MDSIESTISYYKTQCSKLVQTITDTTNNYALSKPFEMYSCIRLMEELNSTFHCYDHIHPKIKETTGLHSFDVGIDITDLEHTIVQCKLYNSSISWKSLSTFFAQQNDQDENGNPFVRWKNLILCRNKESTLSSKLPPAQKKLLKQKIFDREEFIQTIYSWVEEYKASSSQKADRPTELCFREYQLDAIKILIQSHKQNKNAILSLPTGTGKTVIALNYIDLALKKRVSNKFLVLVPTKALLDQWYEKSLEYIDDEKICLVSSDYDLMENETLVLFICVYNSFEKIEHIVFDKIFIDEAHHCRLPNIYDDHYVGDGLDMSDSDGTDSDEADSDSDDGYVDEENEPSFLRRIMKLKEKNNVVEMSATIDNDEDALHFELTLREAIDKKYLTDYQIIVPVFSDSPDDTNIAKYLIREGVKSCIIYCKDCTQGNVFCKILNDIMDGCAAYIDHKTTRHERKRIIKDFNAGIIRFLINVRVLSEGFDSPIAESCVFLHMSSSDVFVVQCIGRILRLHKDKKIANVYLMCSCSEDEKDVERIINIMGENDSLMKERITKKQIGGYISIRKCYQNTDEDVNDDDDEETDYTEDEETDEDTCIEFRYNQIFDSFGKMKSGQEKWFETLENVKKFIRENKIRPSKTSKNEYEKRLGEWISNQQTNHKKKKEIMKNETIYNSWTTFKAEHKEYFRTNEEIWYQTLEEVKQFIKENKKRPSHHSKDEKKKRLGEWISRQQQNHNEKKKVMKVEHIYKEWTSFRKEHKEYFLTNQESWYETLEEVKQFIDKNKRKPSKYSEDEYEKRLGKWISNQQTNHKKKKEIMKNETIYNTWGSFIKEYPSLFNQ